MFADHPDHYRLTDHAGLRMQQRHIPTHLLEMVLEYGRTIHARGATYKVVGRKEVEHFQRKGVDLRDAEGIHVLLGEDDVVLTTYRNHDLRHIRPSKRRHSVYH